LGKIEWGKSEEGDGGLIGIGTEREKMVDV
jgi:hypothetical protein